jgi:hypothetical protein
VNHPFDGRAFVLGDEPDRAPLAAQARLIGARLRAGGKLNDFEFDELYPLSIRIMSTVFWTPIRVALRATQLLVDTPGCRVLDVGSGSGKFCQIGGLTSEGVFSGVERRDTLVECAIEVASLLDVPRVTFTRGHFDMLNPEAYDAFYFFNPFEENEYARKNQFDRRVPFRKESFGDDVQKAERFLAEARPGARVVTYNGFGGKLPPSYDLVTREDVGCSLELWVKDRRRTRAA